MNTVTIDIREKDLVNLRILISLGIDSLLSKGGAEVLRSYPITIFRERMMGSHIITMQIELDWYLLFLTNKMVQ